MSRPTGLAWDGHGVALGVAYAVPAALIAVGDVSKGLAAAVGVLPAAVVGLAPTRHGRRFLALVGFLVGVPIFVGSLVAAVPVIAVAALIGFGIGAAWVAQRAIQLGPLALSLGVPMVGVGLSYTDRAEAAGLATIMIVGSLYACAVSMLWPESVAVPRPPPPPAAGLAYGLRLGLAGATAAAIGFALDLEHVGWAATAAMIVMRPAREMQQLRSVGRLVSVVVGAVVGIVVTRLEPSDAVYALGIVAVIAVVAATNRSRWYITPAFTTLLVFLLLLQSNPASAASRFGERVGETVLGVGLAYVFGVVLPGLTGARRSAAANVPTGGGARSQ